MKRKLVLAIMSIALFAQNGLVASEKQVGYVIEDGIVLDTGMHMWKLEGARKGQYVEFDLENDTFEYITQDEAQEIAEAN